MFPRLLFVLTACFGSAASVASAALPRPMADFVQNWCIDCHDGGVAKGGLNLETLPFGTDEASHAKWVRIFDRVLTGEMPPPKKARPDGAAQRSFLTALGQGLLNQHTAMRGTVLRRLNRAEYENTISDLLGMRLEVRDLLPEDALSHGFDNIGSALGMSDVQLARYMEAAESALNTVLLRAKKPESNTVTLDYKKAAEKSKSWLVREDGAVVFFNDGGFPDTTLRGFRAPLDGRYRVKITGYGYQAKKPVAFALHSGRFGAGTSSDFLGYHELPPDTAQAVTVEAWLRAGETVRISPVLRIDNPKMQKDGPAAYPGTGLAVSSVEVEGPIYDQWPPRGVSLLLGELANEAQEFGEKGRGGRNPRQIIEVKSANPDADAARLIREFAQAAFRRPVDDAKVAPYVALARDELKRGSSFSIAMRTAAIAVLCSPDFLYLREPAGRLDDHALATRLAYFQWRTAPDEELLRLAASGKLRDPSTLRAQTERLLAHENSTRFITDFTDGWLNLREIDFTTPDKKLYPEFDEQLQAAMVAESREFFSELLKSNLSPTRVIASDFTMLNERLADHYGIPDVKGTAIRKVKLPPESNRGGVLTQAAIHKVSANGTNTSPVVRGAWVLERVLGTPPPPPPPGIPGVEPDIRGATTLREQLEKHRDVESCNSCHRVIDPPGFALESFDVIGGWREKFRTIEKGEQVSKTVNGRSVRFRVGPPVDAAGEFADGRKFTGFQEFQKLLLAKPEPVAKCLAEKLLTFGTGREMGFSDRTEVNRIAQQIVAKRGGVRDLVHLVVASPIFQTK